MGLGFGLRLAVPVLLAASAAAGQAEQITVGSIDFFGYKGLDTRVIGAALPIREGQTTADPKDAIRQSLRRVIGRDPTDVATVCCDDKLNWTVFIGLPGESSKQVVYNAAPDGNSRLPAPVVSLNEEIMDAWMKAVSKGRSSEDRSRGYTLFDDPATRVK